MSELATLASAAETSEAEFKPGEQEVESGTLGELSVFSYQETEEASQKVFEYLVASNEAQEETLDLNHFEITWISQEEIDLEHDIQTLSEALQEEKPQGSPPKKTPLKNLARTPSFSQPAQAKPSSEPKQKWDPSHFFGKPKAHAPPRTSAVTKTPFSSLFALAGAINTKNSTSSENTDAKRESSDKTREDQNKPRLAVRNGSRPKQTPQSLNSLEQRREKDKEGSDQDQQQHQEEKEFQRQKKNSKGKNGSRSISRIRSTARSSTHISSKASPWSLMTSTKSGGVTNQKSADDEDVGDIFYKFMALMARILGQAEAEAHALYKKIKGRTDDIDLLTHLIQKINSEKKEIDWSKNEEMKQLIERARQLGVDIPEGKYEWSESEKKLLKENISMRKDGMEKVTQLERTDMQRYLQEASQCHQARSNLLKLLKEVIDTIIHNIRP